MVWDQEVGSSILPAPTILDTKLPLTPPNVVTTLVTTDSILEEFITTKRSTKGLTKSGEYWFRVTLGPLLDWLAVPLNTCGANHIIAFLGQYDSKPWRKRGLYTALKTFWKWVSICYQIPNPMIDQFGNPTIEAPKVPRKVLQTQTPSNVQILIEAAKYRRDKAIVSLLADSGARRSELAGITVNNLHLERSRIKVMGKGGKEGYLVFGPATQELLMQYTQEAQPVGSLFGLASSGVRQVLRRLEGRTGIKGPAHSFRRGFATELRKKGLNDLDIMELGRWSSVSMVQRYTKAFTFDNAAERYQPIVT